MLASILSRNAGNFANTLTIALLLAMQGATGEAVTPHQVGIASTCRPGLLCYSAGSLVAIEAGPAAALLLSSGTLGTTLLPLPPAPLQAEVAWRVQFAVGTCVILLLTAYRWMYLEESKVWKAERHDAAEHLQKKKGVSLLYVRRLWVADACCCSSMLVLPSAWASHAAALAAAVMSALKHPPTSHQTNMRPVWCPPLPPAGRRPPQPPPVLGDSELLLAPTCSDVSSVVF